MIEFKHLSKYFGSNEILHDITLSFPDKGLIVINGENGSGKTTLLNIIACLDSQFHGDYLFNGIDIAHCKESQRQAVKYQYLSYVFQKNHFLS